MCRRSYVAILQQSSISVLRIVEILQIRWVKIPLFPDPSPPDHSISVQLSRHGPLLHLEYGIPLHPPLPNQSSTWVYNNTVSHLFNCHIQVNPWFSGCTDIKDLDNESMPNTPANDHWQLQIASTSIDALLPNSTYITFLPNGSIDMTRTSQTDLDNADAILAPAMSFLQAELSQTFNFWGLINWIFVSFYWIFLSDLGQISPSISGQTTMGVPNNTFVNQRTAFPPTNNIFINQTLFAIYSSYLRNTIIPLLGPVTGDYPLLPPFSNLSFENSLQELDTTFTLSYSCVQRTRKQALAFIVSVIVADYAFIVGAYQLSIMVAAMIQKRRRQDGINTLIMRQYWP